MQIDLMCMCVVSSYLIRSTTWRVNVFVVVSLFSYYLLVKDYFHELLQCFIPNLYPHRQWVGFVSAQIITHDANKHRQWVGFISAQIITHDANKHHQWVGFVSAQIITQDANNL